jgi:hypothetical protein
LDHGWESGLAGDREAVEVDMTSTWPGMCGGRVEVLVKRRRWSQSHRDLQIRLHFTHTRILLTLDTSLENARNGVKGVKCLRERMVRVKQRGGHRRLDKVNQLGANIGRPWLAYHNT